MGNVDQKTLPPVWVKSASQDRTRYGLEQVSPDSWLNAITKPRHRYARDKGSTQWQNVRDLWSLSY